jgi:hypothetical protein
MADVDGDGKNELIVNAMYSSTPGLYFYRPGEDITQPWRKHEIQYGFTGEGTTAADVDGDGMVEIISGPYLYHIPPGGPYAGHWQQTNFALPFREMCRAATVDVTGSGRPAVVLVESEYLDGRLSWFEHHPGQGLVEYPIDTQVYYGHSLSAWRDVEGVHVFVGEMERGGWEPEQNWDARLLLYHSTDEGHSWQRELVYYGAGTHEAMHYDVDQDGEMEIVGKQCYNAALHIWKRRAARQPLPALEHRFLDREKANTATDILAMDVDGDGYQDVVCGSWWYANPTWEKFAIPEIYQAQFVYDLDGDGKPELIASKKRAGAASWYEGLSSQFVWLKPVDPRCGEWEEYPIGEGDGDWAHGMLAAPLLPGGKPALLVGYHSAEDEGARPQLFEVPDDPRHSPWPKRLLADIPYGEEFQTCDLTGNGLMDVIAGGHWLENRGDGSFTPHLINDQFENLARIRLVDVNGDGIMDVIGVQESVNYSIRKAGIVAVVWFENPGDPRQSPWQAHVIDRVRSPHSLDVADLDGDGELELIVGEHDPFKPYRSRSRLYWYKKADRSGLAWKRYTVDDRFEHHDGTKVIELAPGSLGVMSHGWLDSLYVHLWEIT